MNIPQPQGWYQTFIDELQHIKECPVPKGCERKQLFVDDDYNIISATKEMTGARECPIWSWRCPHGIKLMSDQIDVFLEEIDQPRLAKVMKSSAYEETKSVKFCKDIDFRSGSVYGVHGEPGTGKTAGIAIGLFRENLRKRVRFTWMHARDVFKQAQDREWLEEFRDECLVIDDLGTEQDKADYNRETNAAVFDDIVDTCYRRCITLVYTTNIKDMKERYNDRALSRINEDFKAVYLEGEPDYRSR